MSRKCVIYKRTMVHKGHVYTLVGNASIPGAKDYLSEEGRRAAFAAVTLCAGIVAGCRVARLIMSDDVLVLIRDGHHRFRDGEHVIAGPLFHENGQLYGVTAYPAEVKDNHRVDAVVVHVPGSGGGTYAFCRNGMDSDILAHRTEFADSFRGLRVGDRLTFEVVRTPKGIQAKAIRYAS